MKSQLAFTYAILVFVGALVIALGNKIHRLERELNDTQPCVWAVLSDASAHNGGKILMQAGCYPNWASPTAWTTEQMYDNIDLSKRKYNLYLVISKEPQ